jgi:RimJ/RimL family protein N-acetyltransferase
MDSPHRLQFIESKRLRLLAANQALVSADLSGREALAQALGVRVPENWPPELYDRPPMEVAMLQLQDEVQVGWSFWYMVQKQTGGDELLGICGFKGLPDPQGEVEIGYSILSQFRNRGYATEAVMRLVSWALTHQRVNAVIAETLPYLKQSIRVLEKNGFRFAGAGSEHGVVRYRLERRWLN